MKTLSVALTMLPFLAVGSVLAQVAQDPDVLTPRERALDRQPDLHPDWTWMREDQAIQILQGDGYVVVLSLEKSGTAWRGKAMRNNESLHVAINRYGDVYGHLDRKSLARRELIAEAHTTAKAKKTMLATINGSVAVPISQTAPKKLTAGRPVVTVMGEVGWTWMSEEKAQKLFEHKGYANIRGLNRDERGMWRAKAIRDDLALEVAIDIYGNVDAKPVSHGGLAQATPSE